MILRERHTDFKKPNCDMTSNMGYKTIDENVWVLHNFSSHYRREFDRRQKGLKELFLNDVSILFFTQTQIRIDKIVTF